MGDNKINGGSISYHNSTSLTDLLPQKKVNKPLIDFPNALESLSSHSREDSKPIIKDNFSKELDKITLSLEKEINFELESLVNEKDIVESSLTMETMIQQYPELGLKITGLGADFLNSVLNDYIFNMDYVQSGLEITGKVGAWGSLFAAAIGNGAQLVAIAHKGKMLKQSIELLNEYKKQLFSQDPAANGMGGNKFSQLSNQEKAGVKKILKKWEVNIKTFETQLQAEKCEAGISTTLTAMHTGLEIVQSLPLTRIPAFLKYPIAGITAFGSSAISLFEYATDFISNYYNSVNFDSWKDNYQNWKTKSIPRLTLTDLPYGELAQGSLDLLSKRNERFEEKIKLLESQFDSLEPKIQERSRLLYQQKCKNISVVLNNPEASKGSVAEAMYSLLSLIENDQNDACIKMVNQYFTLVLQNAPPKTLRNLQNEIGNELDKLSISNDEFNVTVENHFQSWYKAQPKEELLKHYIDRQETVELTLKNAFKELITKKHQLENTIFKFNLYSSGAVFSIALVCFTASLALSLITALSIPFGGIGIILMVIGVTPVVASLGFLTAGLLLSKVRKPKSGGISLKLTWNRANCAISSYRHQSKLKKLQEATKFLATLHLSKMDINNPDYKKARKKFDKAKIKFDMSELKVQKWEKKLKKYERDLAEKGWQDLVKYASLTKSNDLQAFDSLRAFISALKECNVDLLSDETKYLLETQLGINLEVLQKQLKKDPEVIQDALSNFGALNVKDFLSFISQQSAQLKAGIIPTS